MTFLANWSTPIASDLITARNSDRVSETSTVGSCFLMARVCQVTGKKPITGNSVSHSNIKTKRRFLPNLQKKRFYFIEEDRWITLKVSTDALRTINKNGLAAVVKGLRADGEKI